MGNSDICAGCDWGQCDKCSIMDEGKDERMMPLSVEYHEKGFDRLKVLRELIRILCPDQQHKTFIDAFCHKAEFTRYLTFKTKTYVDCMDYKKIVEPFGEFRQQNCLNIEGHWDFLYCGDGIEHMTEDDAVKFIDLALKISGEQLFITPLGKLWYDPESKDPNAHKSWWDPGQVNFHFRGRFDCIVFHDWYRELVQHPALIFFRGKDYERTRLILDTVNSILGIGGKA
jgi:hypothetical protein